MIEYIKKEPAVILSLLAATLSLAAAFGFSLTDVQQGAVTAFVAVVVGFLTRTLVTPNVSVAAKTQDSIDQFVAGEAAKEAAGIPEGAPVDVVEEGL